jgi:hypothetical protein
VDDVSDAEIELESYFQTSLSRRLTSDVASFAESAIKDSTNKRDVLGDVAVAELDDTKVSSSTGYGGGAIL